MKVDRASIPARVLPWAMSVAIGALSARASAAESWPPATAPVVPNAAPESPRKAPPSAPVVQAPVVQAPVVQAPVVQVPAVQALPDPPPASVTPASSATSLPTTSPSNEPTSGNVTTVRTAPAPASASPRLEAGLSENRFFVRTPGNGVVLFPGGLLNVDGRSFRTGNLDAPNDEIRLDRARPELAGLFGGVVGFNAAVDLAHGPSVRGVDNFVSVAPWADRAILQVGRFDAPFTMDNRISDRGLDFLDRSTLARAFAIPENKKSGAMVHGTNAARNYYYAAGGFLSDGQTDGMARAWIAPFSFGRGPELLRDVTVGGSAWLGQAKSGAAFAPQTTASGFLLLDPSTRWFDGTDETDVALHTSGSLGAGAIELNAPFRHKLGVRFELATKRQSLSVLSMRNGGMPVSHGGLELDGWATYGEVSYWLVGDDRIVGEQGLQLPTRLGTMGLARPVTGVMLAARLERLDENLFAGDDPTIAADVVSAHGTKLTTLTLGANVWFARRLRATFNYAWNHPSGDALFLTRLTDSNIHELSLRFAIVL